MLTMQIPAVLGLSAAAAAEPVAVPTPEPTVLLQTWITAFDMDENPQADPASYGDPEDDPGFKIRRARAGFEGANDRLRYGVVFGVSAPYDAVEAEEGGMKVGVVDAYGGFSPVAPLWITAGLQRVPVSREMLMSARDLVFTDRAVPTEWLSPGRDVGLLLDGTLGPGRLQLGVYNGNGALVGDDSLGKLFAGRLELAIGPGDVYQTFGVVDGLSFGVGADGTLDSDLATSTLGVGGDLILRVAGLAVLAEGRMTRATPTHTDVAEPDVLDATTRIGAMAQVGYTVGDFEPAVRFSLFDDDTAYDDNGDVADLTAGVTWHTLEDAVRVGAGYVLRLERAGASSPNDTARLWVTLAL